MNIKREEQLSQTPTITSELNPKYDETFTFENVKVGYNLYNNIYDKDTHTVDDHIGRGSFDILEECVGNKTKVKSDFDTQSEAYFTCELIKK